MKAISRAVAVYANEAATSHWDDAKTFVAVIHAPRDRTPAPITLGYVPPPRSAQA